LQTKAVCPLEALIWVAHRCAALEGDSESSQDSLAWFALHFATGERCGAQARKAGCHSVTRKDGARRESQGRSMKPEVVILRLLGGSLRWSHFIKEPNFVGTVSLDDIGKIKSRKSNKKRGTELLCASSVCGE